MVTATHHESVVPASGLLGKLMAAVRPEFRADVIAPSRSFMFDESRCRVPNCDRDERSRGLCNGHYIGWWYAGKPDISEYVLTATPLKIGGGGSAGCSVPGCHYSTDYHGVCRNHNLAWRRAGKPPFEQWLANVAPVTDSGHPVCALPFCQLWSYGHQQFCMRHHFRWRRHGRPELGEFITLLTSYGNDRFDFRVLADRPQLKLELQYALQCRYDERKAKTPYGVGRVVITLVASTEVCSLLDWSAERWSELYAEVFRPSSNKLAFLRYAHRCVADLNVGTGWEAEYPRDVWEMRRLGYDHDKRLRFDGIPQIWLQELAKRYARWRLSTDLSFHQVYNDTQAITRFAQFIAGPTVHAVALRDITRSVLEQYLAWRTTDTQSSRGRDITSLNGFFDSIRRHEWDTSLPANAAFYSDDYPKRNRRLPRALAEHIMAQVEHATNLDRWTYPEDRIITVLLMRCGLRIGDARRILFDCIVRDADSAPYLRYTNNKMKREALVPIDEEVERFIIDQQRRVQQRWPEHGSPWLFPALQVNPDGRKPWTGYHSRLTQWLDKCDVKDEHGQPVHLTPHQWRHTFGTRLINRDVPQEVVRKLLDHSSSEMTAHYARLHDTTVRQHWEQARKVNMVGDTITLDPNGPLAEAQWAKQRLGRVTQALPNGFCGLPVQKTCPHANACLTCPMFVTTAEFLPQHHEHRQQVLHIISRAETNGQQRLVEMNRQVLGNLDSIIGSLENDSDRKESSDARR